ncbi:pyridoxal phosphate-dependent transferase [Aspergillus oleicola]
MAVFPASDDGGTTQTKWTGKLNVLHKTLTQAYIASNHKSKAAHEEAQKYLPGGNTRSVLHYCPFPLSLRSGQGCRVTSLDGDEYLDFVSEYSAALFGHSHPLIIEAVQNAAQDRGFNLGAPNPDEATLARHIVSRFRSVDKVRFTNSGTEANMMALAVALAYTGRKKILVFANGYHGAFANFGHSTINNLLNIPHDFVVGQYNEITSNEQFLTSELAAILVEPMQGAGGMIPGSPEFLSFLQSAATRTGAVLIFDEIITSRFHIGGFSFGAFGGRADVMALLEPGPGPKKLFHSGTHNNNMFSMAAGVAASRILTVEGIHRINGLGDRLRDGINGIYIGKRGFLSLNLVHQEEDVEYVLSAIREFVQQLQGP